MTEGAHEGGHQLQQLPEGHPTNIRQFSGYHSTDVLPIFAEMVTDITYFCFHNRPACYNPQTGRTIVGLLMPRFQ